MHYKDLSELYLMFGSIINNLYSYSRVLWLSSPCCAVHTRTTRICYLHEEITQKVANIQIILFLENNTEFTGQY